MQLRHSSLECEFNTASWTGYRRFAQRELPRRSRCNVTETPGQMQRGSVRRRTEPHANLHVRQVRE